MRFKTTFYFLILSAFAFSQSKKIDSLRTVLRTAKEDTAKYSVLMKLGDLFIFLNSDSAIYFHTQAKQLSETLNEKLKMYDAITLIGCDFMVKGDYPKALSLLTNALEYVDRETPDRKNLSLKAKILINMGAAYLYQADNTRALNHYLKALKIAEEINDKNNTAKGLVNIGMIYRMQADHSRALEYDFKALKLAEELKNRRLQAKVLGELGNAYRERYDHEQALNYFLKAYKISEELENKNGMTIYLSNIGLICMDQSHYDQALDYYFKALKIAESLGDKYSTAVAYGNIGAIYVDTKKYTEAEKYLKKALQVNHELHGLEGIQYQEKTYSKLDSIRGNFKGALEHYKKYIAARDSITNEENTKKQTRAEMQFEFDKKEAQTKADQEKKDAIAAADKKRQNIILLSISGFGLLVLVFAIFAYRSFIQKKKANEEISKQKELIEEKQKEILDSIYYARRIQRCLLPSEKYIEKRLGKWKGA